jgi:hypothetical protein
MEELLAILLAQLTLLMLERLLQYTIGTIRATATST